MQTISRDGVTLHVDVSGAADGFPIIFANSLGTDLRVWDLLLPYLGDGYRIIRFDKRGHGLSDCPDAPYSIDDLALDVIAVADAFDVTGAAFVGLSIGGLIGQAVALKRPDLVSSLVLMDTAAKIGEADMWNARVAALRDGGIEGIAEAVLDRWFATALRNDPVALAPWRNMLVRSPLEGYIGCCQAIAAADYRAAAAQVDVPVMAMVGADDLATAPDVVRATAELYGAAFHVLPDAGHLPCVEQPQAVARLITEFLERTLICCLHFGVGLFCQFYGMVRARNPRINRNVLKRLKHVLFGCAGPRGGANVHRDFFEIAERRQQGQRQHRPFTAADCVRRPDIAPSALGDQGLKLQIKVRFCRLGAINMGVAQNLATRFHSSVIAIRHFVSFPKIQ